MKIHISLGSRWNIPVRNRKHRQSSLRGLVHTLLILYTFSFHDLEGIIHMEHWEKEPLAVGVSLRAAYKKPEAGDNERGSLSSFSSMLS